MAFQIFIQQLVQVDNKETLSLHKTGRCEGTLLWYVMYFLYDRVYFPLSWFLPVYNINIGTLQTKIPYEL